jgi:microcystin-dependent protein
MILFSKPKSFLLIKTFFQSPLKIFIMKSTFTLLFFLCFGISAYAQNGISFQGIARDPQGNAIVNKTIPVKFTIGSFTESQNLATDNFGVFSATIGSVNTTGFNNLVFANISDNLKVEVDGTTIYDDKFNSVPYAKAAENGVPPGSIMPFAGPVNKKPDGWLICDGSSLAKTGIYQKLYEAIGTLWGDDGGNFKIPDLRGMFLRGVNNGRTGIYADPDTRSVGSFQEDDNKEHNHLITDPGHIHTITDPGHIHTYKGITDNTGGGAIDDAGGSGTTNTSSVTTGITINNRQTGITINNTGTESRPNNAAILYLIKY